jgi:hypothetical protein
VLFGAGNSCQTTSTDAMGDGVSNNGGSPTSDALGLCNACNTHTSTYADDDGGFLRVFVGQYYAGSQVSRPFQAMYTLDGYGGMHGDDSPAVSASAFWPGWKIARSAKPWPAGGQAQSGLVLDGWGGLHPYGSGITSLSQSGYWPNWDIARGLVLSGSGHSGYVLDGWGGLHQFYGAGDTAPAQISPPGYWPNWDIARAVWLVPETASEGYTLDGWGGLHPFGGAPPISTFAYWPGQDIAVALSGS